MTTPDTIEVIKRDGSREILNLDKIHKVLFWACEDITGVSVSEIELRAQLQLADGIKTTEIHETIIRAASDLISEETPNYQFVAARLINYQLRKEIYGGPTPCSVKELVVHNVQAGVYDQMLLTEFNDDDFLQFDDIIKHKRDFELSFVAMEQFRGKYLVRNRVTGQFYETPQMAYLLIAATMFVNDGENRMEHIKEYYDIISTHKISLPTPVMAKARKPERQFSSCVLVTTDDTMRSIEATTSVIYRYISNSAGLGIDVGSIRAIGSQIRNGDTESTGLIPFIRSFQSAVKSCSQGGIRGGAGTVTYPFFHYEFDSLVVLKNNKGTEMNRIRQLDYCVQFNRLAYRRLTQNKDITFFSPQDVPDLMDAFYSGNNDLFEELYVKYENNDSIRKHSMKAIELFSSLMTERKETGRIYIQNIDHANNHGSFKPELAPIKQTNLCVTGDTSITVLRVSGEIEEVNISDLGQILFEDDDDTFVWSHDTKTSESNFKPIKAWAETSASTTVMRITDETTGVSIKCTPDHQLYTKNRGYIAAKELHEDDELLYKVHSANSKILKIETLEEQEAVYDITVGDNENFFANGILVHNCVEIDLPTRPLDGIEDPNGWVALCTLSAINWGKIKRPEDFEHPARLAVRALDNLIDFQSYPVKAAETHTKLFRPLGIGIINLAYFLAKNDKKYDNDALELIHEYAEAWSYYLIRASVDLAKEKGPCEGLHMTKYSEGVLPIDTRARSVDTLVEHKERLPWEELRNDLKKYGIRNATLMALMPSETSAQIANATNGIEPPRGLVSEKVSKHGVLKQVVPEIHKLKNKYDLLWDQPSPTGYLNIMAVLQTFTDQGISVNISYNPELHEDGSLSMKMLINDLLHFYKFGGKQLYYHNTYDGQRDESSDYQQEQPVLEELEETECESCVL